MKTRLRLANVVHCSSHKVTIPKSSHDSWIRSQTLGEGLLRLTKGTSLR